MSLLLADRIMFEAITLPNSVSKEAMKISIKDFASDLKKQIDRSMVIKIDNTLRLSQIFNQDIFKDFSLLPPHVGTIYKSTWIEYKLEALTAGFIINVVSKINYPEFFQNIPKEIKYNKVQCIVEIITVFADYQDMGICAPVFECQLFLNDKGFLLGEPAFSIPQGKLPDLAKEVYGSLIYFLSFGMFLWNRYYLSNKASNFQSRQIEKECKKLYKYRPRMYYTITGLDANKILLDVEEERRLQFEKVNTVDQAK
jgi:hypothetical protein